MTTVGLAQERTRIAALSLKAALQCCASREMIRLAMTVTADERKRVTLPDAKPGESFDYTRDEQGRILLRPAPVAIENAARIVKTEIGKNGLPYIPGVKVTREEIARAIREERDSR